MQAPEFLTGGSQAPRDRCKTRFLRTRFHKSPYAKTSFFLTEELHAFPLEFCLQRLVVGLIL